MKKYVLIASILLFISTVAGFSLFDQNSGEVAIIDLSGSISPSGGGGLSPSGVTPEEVRDLNDRAVNQGADAVIYEINSGGGAVVASKEVYRDIEDVEVPTVCRMRDVAASGAYLVALGCDRIVADSATLTGSIGVRSSYLQYSGLLERFDIEYVNISKGGLKEVGNPYQNTTEEEKQVLQDKVDRLHEDFVSQVDSNRNLTNSSRDEVASSEPFLGDRAVELGLVDEIGGRETAVESAENMTGKDLNTFEVQSASGVSFLSLLTADLSVGDLFRSDSPLQASIF